MPRQSVVNFSKIADLLKNSSIKVTNTDGDFLGPADKCWMQLAELYGNISSKYMYTIVSSNRHNVLELPVTIPSPISTDDSPDAPSDVSSAKSSMRDHYKFILSFEVKEWRNMVARLEHKDKKLGKRTYTRLKPHHWTDIFSLNFYRVTKLPCTLVFKDNKFHQDGEFYLKVVAYCSSCHSNLRGVIYEKPDLDSVNCVSIDCLYEGEFRFCQSSKKRRLIGNRQAKYSERMTDKNMSASFVRRNEAKKLMEFGEREPNILPTANALRQLKFREKKKSFPHEHPILSLSLLKSVAPYSGVIRDIGLEEFFVHYWSKEELSCYEICSRQNRDIVVSIDATGSVVQRIKLFSGGDTKSIFLYEVVLHDKKNNLHYAVSHMLSARHTANAIAYWLLEWIRSGVVKLPSTVVTDSSFALMHAVCKSFTQFTSLWDYLSCCATLLLHPEIPCTLPRCFVRNDVNHVIHMFAKWNEVRTASRNVKNFYMRSLGLIVTSTQYEEAKEIIELIFIVALSKENGENCMLAKRELKNKISKHFELMPSVLENSEGELLDEVAEEEPTPNTITEEIEAVYQRALTLSSDESNCSDEDNALHCSTLAIRLKKFCKLLPVWSGVMVPIFGYGEKTVSSAASESSFNDVKNRIMHHKRLPIRVDDFLMTHCDAIIGGMHLVRSEAAYLKEVEKSEEVRKEEKTETSTVSTTHKPVEIIEKEYESRPESCEENWRGLGKVSGPLRKRKTYLLPDPTILHVDESSKSSKKVFGLLQNGSKDCMSSIKINENMYTLTNTCPFDAVMQILFTSFADSKLYAEYVSANVDNLLFEMMRNANRDGITAHTYVKRAKILLAIKSLYKPSAAHGTNHYFLNCASSAFSLIRELFINCPSSTELLICPSCCYEKTVSFSSITVDLFTDVIQSSDVLQDFLLNRISNRTSKCHNCSEYAEVRLYLGRHLFFELGGEKFQDTKFIPCDVTLSLSNIPLMITLSLENRPIHYKLRGAISFIQPLSKSVSALGHYVAYCYRQEERLWELHDDLKKEIRSVRGDVIIKNCQFLVYTL